MPPKSCPHAVECKGFTFFTIYFDKIIEITEQKEAKTRNTSPNSKEKLPLSKLVIMIPKKPRIPEISFLIENLSSFMNKNAKQLKNRNPTCFIIALFEP